MTATPRLPDPLTPDGLRSLMRERPYGDTSHPRSPLYHRLVQRGFEILYPGPARTDAIGQRIDIQPLKPQYVAHLVAQANRKMEDMERGFDEKPSRAGGEVHVQSHSREGGKVEVADYWRSRPGEVGGESGSNGSSGADSGNDTGPGSPGPLPPPKDAHVAPDVGRLVREWSGTHVGESKECVALLKEAVPGIGATPTWKEGEKLKGPGDPPLAPGTAIATFENGKYPSRSTGNHAAIVIGPGVQDGKAGYWVLDQSRDRPAGRRFIAFDGPSKLFTSRLENYSVIRKAP